MIIVGDPTNFNESKLLDIWQGDCEERFEVVEEGEWEDQGKFSSQEVIFKDSKTGNHYSFGVYRSGSYFSHYEYEVYDTAEEVEQIEKTITIKKWVHV